MENKLTVVQEGALPPLAKLLESPEEEVQLQVISNPQTQPPTPKSRNPTP